MRKIPLMAVAIAALAVAFTNLVLTVGTAYADCMMDERPYDQRIEEAEVVFVGTVTATAHSETTAEVAVEEIWKGPDLEAEEVVIGGSGQDGAMTSVDRFFQVGETYLFLPFPEDGVLRDNSCTSTAPMSPDLAVFRPDDARTIDDGTVAMRDGDGFSVPMPVVASLAFLVLGFGAWKLAGRE